MYVTKNEVKGPNSIVSYYVLAVDVHFYGKFRILISKLCVYEYRLYN